MTKKQKKNCKISIRRRTIHSIKNVLILWGWKRILSQLLSSLNLPRTQTSLFRWKLARKGRRERDNGRGGAKPPVCTLSMVPYGSSLVTRVSRSPLPCEKRSAWGGGCRRILTSFPPWNGLRTPGLRQASEGWPCLEAECPWWFQLCSVSIRLKCKHIKTKTGWLFGLNYAKSTSRSPVHQGGIVLYLARNTSRGLIKQRNVSLVGVPVNETVPNG